MKRVDVAPAGTYFIGDPCYVIDHNNEDLNDLWSNYCDMDGIGEGVMYRDEITGVYLAGQSTQYGDGEYFDQAENSYSVDSGLLGAASVSHLSKAQIERLKHLGQVVEMVEGFTVRSCPIVKIGHIEIDTDPRRFWGDCEDEGYDDEDY